MAKRVKKEKIQDIPPQEVPKESKTSAVSIYKVVIAPCYSYYTRSINPILKVFFTSEEAEKFIQEYPFLWIKPFLSIETQTQVFQETD